MEPLDVRRECRKYAEKFLDLQREQFKRIGVFGRFDHPYATMTPQYESVVLTTFYAFMKTDFVYKGLRAVYWCMHDETALAEAEVEYENHTSQTVWVKYALARRSLRRSILRSPARKFRPSSGPPRPGRFPRRWRWPSIPTKNTWRSSPRGEVYIVAAKLAADVAEKCNLAGPEGTRALPRQQAGAR